MQTHFIQYSDIIPLKLKLKLTQSLEDLYTQIGKWRKQKRKMIMTETWVGTRKTELQSQSIENLRNIQEDEEDDIDCNKKNAESTQ